MTAHQTQHSASAKVETSIGTIEYVDRGSGPVVVLLHGLLMDPSLWDGVVADLERDHRCVVPALPLGAHRIAVADDADLSLGGIARVATEFIERLGLENVTLVGNDTGGAVAQALVSEKPAAVARLVLASCEAFDNWPPGLTGRTVATVGKLPPRLFGAFMQQMRLRPVRRLPLAFGSLTKRGDAATAAWMRPLLRDRAIRRDAVRALRALFADKDVLTEISPRISRFSGPALVVWGQDDRVMPLDHGRRLARTLPDASFVEIPDTRTLIPLDQPTAFAEAVRGFVRKG